MSQRVDASQPVEEGTANSQPQQIESTADSTSPNEQSSEKKVQVKCKPTDLTEANPLFSLHGETWVSLTSSPCSFRPDDFESIMENLIRNPNLTSTHLFRAEIFYDSLNDMSARPDIIAPDVELTPEAATATGVEVPDVDVMAQNFSQFTKHMREEYRPRKLRCRPSGYEWRRTWVRRLVPRNPELDRDLVQTCHLFKKSARSGLEHQRILEGSPSSSGGDTDGSKGKTEETIVFYLPHAGSSEELPFYQPNVRNIAFQHVYRSTSPGELLIHCQPFESGITTRLQRTALKILQIIHKHANGRATGYQKKVHHDLVVPQDRMQDTYTRLKGKYAKDLVGEWVEHTDPMKHVFEDLAIAAFLMELWRQMYGIETHALGEGQTRVRTQKPERPFGDAEDHGFPGFVDIGCGNGVLVFLLRAEGYMGWGFDIRKRKTWATFPMAVREHLKEMTLVPELYIAAAKSQEESLTPASTTKESSLRTLTGMTSQETTIGSASAKEGENKVEEDDHELDTALTGFGMKSETKVVFQDGNFPQGTFIISNHADELTAWTPMLAYLSDSPFIAIPCCSHDFAGARFRAPGPGKAAQGAKQSNPQTGSLKPGKANQPSAYASLCAWVERLTIEVGYEAEKEMLRIPSTRNACILGRKIQPSMKSKFQGQTYQQKSDTVREVVERELRKSVETAAKDWLERTTKISTSSKASGH